MKLTLQNIGIVHSAELELNGLTVITGYNGIGKSIVGKALYCALSARYEGRYQPDKDVKERIEEVKKFITFEERLKKLNDSSRKSLREILKNHVNSLVNSIYKYNSNNKTINIRTVEELQRLSSIIDKRLKDDRLILLLKELDYKVTKDTTDVYTFEHDDLIQSTFKNSYNNKLSTNRNSLLKFNTKQENIVKVEVENNKTTTIDFTQDVFSDILLIETPTILSLFRYIKENLAFNNNQNKLLPDYIKDLIQKLSESSYTPNYDKSICQSIQEIIKGRVIIENEQLFYEDESKEKHAINNVATGIKSLGMLQLLLAGDAILPGSLLVVDEPEVHLHPAWQLEYARVLVELVKEGVEVIINSHSSYFIEALDVYTQNEEIAEKLNVYLGEMTEQGSVFKDVTENLEPVYKAFAAPMVELMVERSRGKRKPKEEITK